MGEQASIIEFLVKKTGTKCRDIKDLCNEAVAKIPQIQPIELLESVSDKNKKNISSTDNNTSNITRKSSERIIVNVKHDSSKHPSSHAESHKVSNKQDLTSIYEYSDSQ